MEKRCTKCDQVKPIAEFYRRKAAARDGHRSDCKACVRARRKGHYAINAEAILAQQKGSDKARYATDEGSKRIRERRWRARGIDASFSMPKYNRLCDEQGHVCALCGDGNTKSGKPCALSADHSHQTGVVRGLLCHQCNRRLGRIDRHGLLGPHRCGAAFTSQAFVYLLTATLRNGCPQYRSQNITQSTI